MISCRHLLILVPLAAFFPLLRAVFGCFLWRSIWRLMLKKQIIFLRENGTCLRVSRCFLPLPSNAFHSFCSTSAECCCFFSSLFFSLACSFLDNTTGCSSSMLFLGLSLAIHGTDGKKYLYKGNTNNQNYSKVRMYVASYCKHFKLWVVLCTVESS